MQLLIAFVENLQSAFDCLVANIPKSTFPVFAFSSSKKTDYVVPLNCIYNEKYFS